MEKNIQKIKIKNQLELWAFCAVIGTVAGALVWALLKIMASGTEMIWEWIPEKIHIPYYTVLVCTVGGAIIGIFRKLYGDYPEDMETVMGKVKKEKRYEYKNMLVMMIAALLPLLIGSSVGPEAGLTGIIVGLCYWAGEKDVYKRQDKQIKIVKEGLGVLPGTIVIPFSSVTKQGRDEIWELVERNYLNTQENEE